MAEQATLTRFFIFETRDGQRSWVYKGEVLARDRDQAARLFWGAPGDEPVTCVAVSENAWKPKIRKPRIVTRTATEDVEMPSLGEPVTESTGPSAEADAVENAFAGQGALD